MWGVVQVLSAVGGWRGGLGWLYEDSWLDNMHAVLQTPHTMHWSLQEPLNCFGCLTGWYAGGLGSGSSLYLTYIQ